MSSIEIIKLEILLPGRIEVYEPGKDDVRVIRNDGDGISVMLENNRVIFYSNAVPFRCDWQYTRFNKLKRSDI